MQKATEMGTPLTLKQIAELHLSDFISSDEYRDGLAEAQKKLARIIERYGDADGARKDPEYLAILIAEAVTAKRFTEYCVTMNEKRTMEKKKKRPQPKSQGISHSRSLLYHTL